MVTMKITLRIIHQGESKRRKATMGSLRGGGAPSSKEIIPFPLRGRG